MKIKPLLDDNLTSSPRLRNIRVLTSHGSSEDVFPYLKQTSLNNLSKSLIKEDNKEKVLFRKSLNALKLFPMNIQSMCSCKSCIKNNNNE